MSAEDAMAALDLGADYISFENVKTSKRYLDFSQISEFEKTYFEWTNLLNQKSSKEFQNLSLSLTNILYSL